MMLVATVTKILIFGSQGSFLFCNTCLNGSTLHIFLFNLNYVFVIHFHILHMLGSPYLVELLELLVGKAVQLRKEVLQT